MIMEKKENRHRRKVLTLIPANIGFFDYTGPIGNLRTCPAAFVPLQKSLSRFYHLSKS